MLGIPIGSTHFIYLSFLFLFLLFFFSHYFFSYVGHTSPILKVSHSIKANLSQASGIREEKGRTKAYIGDLVCVCV